MLLKICGIAPLLLLALALPPCSDAYSTPQGSPQESQLKAVFVLNFAKLTEWPEDLRVEGANFTIAIVGKEPPATFINILRGQTVHGAKVSVRYIEEVSEAKGAQLVYITASERHRITTILREINQQIC